MRHQILTIISIAFYISIMVACQDASTPSRAPRKQSAEDGTASLRIKVPGPTIFPISNGSPGDYLNSFLLRVTTDSQLCADAQIYELRDYKGAETISLKVNKKCSFKIRFAIGKESSAGNLNADSLALDIFYSTEESLEIASSDLKQGDITVRLHLKRTALGEKIGFTNPWAKDDLSTIDTSDEDEEEQEIVDTQPQTQPDNGGTTIATQLTYENLKDTINRSCASCHRPNGSRPQSDLSTYEGFKRNGAAAVARITAGTMPPRPASPLSQDTVKAFTEWQKAGFPANGNSTQNSSPNTGDQRIVEFRIKSGTGSGAWNTQNAPLTLKVGQVLRIINDDTIRHRLHTDGAPCPHGNDIAPGKSEDCVISRPFTAGNLYDHNNLGRFYIKAER